MKTFIFAIDACDYRRVEEWNLKHLQQSQHGHFRSIINKEIGVPVSPQVWGSFLTGKVQNIGGWRKYKFGLNIMKRYVPSWLRNKLFIFVSFFFPRSFSYRSRTDLNDKTIFDCVEKSVAINVPMWNLDISVYVEMLKKKLNSSVANWEKEVYDNYFIKFLQNILESIDTDWNLFMAWTPLLDSFGHMVHHIDEETIYEAYHHLNTAVEQIKRTLDDDVLFIIISDHGMEGDNHSLDCFYSFNKKIDFIPHKITDFFNYIFEANT